MRVSMGLKRRLRITQRAMEGAVPGVGTYICAFAGSNQKRRDSQKDPSDRRNSTCRIKWQGRAGHIARRSNGRERVKGLKWRPRTGKCSVSRPPTRWTEDIKRCRGESLALSDTRWCRYLATIQKVYVYSR